MAPAKTLIEKENLMDDLIEALQIFRKYSTAYNPTHCEHDILMIMDVPEDIEEKDRLDELGFHWDKEYGCWVSYRFGSA